MGVDRNTPSSYKQDDVSSLSVAFEDPDSSKSKALLAERHLYIFGTRATAKKWKYRQTNKDKSKDSASKHLQAGDADDEQDVEITLQSQPLPSSFRAIPPGSTKPPTLTTAMSTRPPSRPQRGAASKACNVIKEALEGDQDH